MHLQAGASRPPRCTSASAKVWV
uniref:Uncharacterized protein n=1 Tax=Arundo donax TaxID=35708 RepID=A0A0A9AYK2_ARUDO